MPADLLQQQRYKPEIYRDLRRPVRILVCVIGRTPQIITETVYALAKDTTPTWIPDEIQAITTKVGHDDAVRTLFEGQAFDRLLAELDEPPIRFGPDYIDIVHRGGRPLQDIRTPSDNMATANVIVEKIRKLTGYANTELHVSLAGGRKSMGFFAGYALSIFGRQQDQLSHVLVSPPFESHPKFFFPTTQKSELHDRDGNVVGDARNATVTLANIPYARLENLTSVRAVAERLDYTALCRVLEQGAHVQLDLENLTMIFSKRLKIFCSPKHGLTELRMQPRYAALYAYYVYRAWRGDNLLSDSELMKDSGTLTFFYQMFSNRKQPSAFMRKHLELYRSKANAEIRKLIKDGKIAARYVIAPDARKKKYGVSLTAAEIDIRKLPENL